MLGREQTKGDPPIGEFLEPVQLFHARAGKVSGEPIRVTERGQIEGFLSEVPNAFFVQVVIVAVGDEDHLRTGQLPRREGKRDMAGNEGPYTSKNRVGEDILVLEMDPQCRVSQVGDGVASRQNLSYRGTNHRKLGWMALGRGVRVGTQNPFQQLPKRRHLISPGPGVDKARILVMGLGPAELFQVRLLEWSCRRRLPEQDEK
jgi:hypothetical protein